MQILVVYIILRAQGLCREMILWAADAGKFLILRVEDLNKLFELKISFE